MLPVSAPADAIPTFVVGTVGVIGGLPGLVLRLTG